MDLCVNRLQETLGKARAVLINSGQANACTGDLGLIDSLRATQELASRLEILPEEVLMCSTGVIGVPIPISHLLDSLNELIDELSEAGGSAAANAILTTDLVEKQFALEAHLGGRCVRIGGMAKGSGMIHPNMATMLAFLSCDVGVPSQLWQQMIKRVVDRSFNAITVDGDTSTNDSFLAFSAGAPLAEEYLDELEIGLTLVSQYLAKAIARDGEGANCLIEVVVQGAVDVSEARRIARTIAGSSLVKTAIHGCDPNWGRIVAAAGRAGVFFKNDDISLWLGPYQLLREGKPCKEDREIISRYMQKCLSGNYLVDDLILIRMVVGSGPGDAIAWGCDLSEKYIRINADYTT